MKKILILVMSSEKPPYRQMLTASEATWASGEVDGAEVVFYYGYTDHQMPTYYANGFTYLSLPVKETLNNVSQKTEMAFKWALQNTEFDYILRANASTYIDKQAALDYVQDKPATYFGGLPADTTQYGDLKQFMWGVQYIISRDLVELSVSKPWDYTKMDDISLSLALKDQVFSNGKLLTLHKKEDGYEYIEYNEGKGGGGFVKDLLELPKGHYAYRCKQEGNRSLDCEIIRELWRSKQN